MLNRIISFSIKNKLIIGILTIALIAWGLWSASRLPIDAVPDITNNQVQVITVAPSQSALDIERLVTFPVEQTMATIPGIEEMRSFSRFGLSVVTIVFKDDIDVYWARQQANERLNEAQKLIPPGVGAPSLAPVTTGLGEIYQYIIRPKKGFENKYTPADLRTMQDWIVRRQLLGVGGVADVASFGGYLKQYEIAIDPDRLRSYNLGVADLFAALEKNNQNTGGAYIDKKPNAYFIRSEGLIGSTADIGKIVIKNTPQGIPVLIRDVATIGFGHATRYGAMTYNDKGEVVGAIALMLKGENSSAVVNRVKERMKQIEKTLPEGVEIDAFLDRSELVGRAIGTVETNLIEGALIVIFVLVLFLGNFRAGLIVASVIPLAMLFAVAMMRVFGVSGNLMSLGAIDFGLIVDGAVIIVEATMHHLGLRKNKQQLSQAQMDAEVFESASKIRNSAAFGEIIILIVYLPILALVGVEGKMFKPMAQTVAFAILGAFLLSLTYVPMMCATFLNKKMQHKRNFSDRMMEFFQRMYTPLIKGALKKKFLIVFISVVMFVVSLLLFMRMGGEFLPTLEEGDFAVETRVLTGSSLSQTVEATTKGAAILLREYPDEVIEVVGKIGSSEIPTDPMPIEAADMMVILKPKKEWKKAHNREELAEMMTESLEAIPGVTFGFQQPIQMRFNELMTGVRQDVAVKIYGEDLEILADLANQVGKISSGVQGARDIYVEQVTGLPQIVININRDEIAKYGLDIKSINQTINAAFAGQSAGMIFEGEKRFELVLRLNRENREKLDDVRNLYITTPNGNQVPLQQIADVNFRVGPNQIQREDAKRRIIVGFNTRGRDVSSIVKELKEKISTQVKMPPGYFATYGGQFENLQQANARLSIAVPVALLLIFLLLFFTFNSLKQAALIFTAIPMAAIGGVLALLIREMPFSISAGVGFIALFGVAVLNGIVLIAEFNRLKQEGISDLNEIILKGTKIRLRPVLMTAAVASLGFLPMALATSAGAEVQKPLATVVIGGLITSTFLTLIVLPCLYIYFEKTKFKRVNPNKLSLFFILLLMLFVATTKAQQSHPITLEQAVQQALAQNKLIQSAELEKQYQRQLKSAVGYIGKTDFSAMIGQYNSYKWGDNNFSVSQNIPNPKTFSTQRALGDALIGSADARKIMMVNELTWNVKQVYYELLFLYNKERLLQQQDSIYTEFLKAAELRFKTGETKLLEKTTAETQLNEIRNLLKQNGADIQSSYYSLQQLTGSDEPVSIVKDSLRERGLTIINDTASVSNNPFLAYLKQQIQVASKEREVFAAQKLPDFTLGYFNQSLIGNPLNGSGTKLATAGDRFMGFNAGIAISIFNKPLRAKVKAAEINTHVAETQLSYNQGLLKSEWKQAAEEYQKYKSSVEYYKTSAIPNANLILYQARRGYQEGDADYAEYLLATRNALQIKENYLQTINQLNQSVIRLEYLAGNQ
ncbi:CusA/CzcA family heavy metal efflux RND transporter [Paraflavitalea sp. CAU 1676]|uniref:CusA/CzcA family heavy metal efflux RND transporter n=1 Tax=Paraflavitalea sp. CAU 1676 TaxID=3032598 RepID=UPI0023DBC35C|nr:CusA/CzcA family heavy metal efflux RND transporter [Paraflavitalea sp. CAU 1676]MDF2191321.1 CusA/CzcA family heavy metal efflux RND transporter [Paraflavitalea sp. CAU 1676]